MTDIRSRLADALRDLPVDLGPLYPACRLVSKNREQIADVLLSLPGIAIVELPTANVWDIAEINFGVNPMTPGLAREIAAGLLAAAVQAQEEQ